MEVNSAPSPLGYVTTYLHEVRIHVWMVTGEMRGRYETADHYIGELIHSVGNTSGDLRT